MTSYVTHRLDGLEPDNLLAFMALLGLLRTLEEVRPEWHPRVSWTVDKPPLRPALRVPEGVDGAAVVHATAEGLDLLAGCHEFDGLVDLTLPPEDAAGKLREITKSVDQNRYAADLWAALVSDAAISRDGKKVEATPLCLMFGQGHQHFLERLKSVPQQKTPPKRGKRRSRITVSETDCLRKALFASWKRPDATQSFRWDPNEDVRYALRARNPTDPKTKETTQHGANRLAAVGLSLLTVAPRRRAGQVRLTVLGGQPEPRGGFVFRWPIWQAPISLAAIRALLGHPDLGPDNKLAVLGVKEVRQARQISTGKFMNFTRAEPTTAP
ncbi:MAG: hypothetical protein TQ37_03505 [Candidatus Synechococcus spongiarum 15L]|uniref:CRISPR-associated protein Csb3 n=1 Tax=Candidatus Synechococcus spongiarum 15L TaxID=1608419 RepID=A0A0G8AWM0_9SYNE|nr:MAG: hypothetical protein TQ37_03505 [Candidatus Synechococcus spongiarum 15L]